MNIIVKVKKVTYKITESQKNQDFPFNYLLIIFSINFYC